MKSVYDADGTPRTRLETWGEIAQHLGVEVRTAQRWEGRMGLPVRRLEGSQAVFAMADELDAWRRSRETKVVAPPVIAAPPAPDLSVPPSPASHRVRGAGVSLAVVALGVLAVAAVRWGGPLMAGEPVDFALEGTRLVAVDAGGTPLWRYDFNASATALQTIHRAQMRRWWRRMDTDGDGTDEIVAVIGHPRGESDPRDVLYCFTLDGRLRYAYTPDFALSFGQQRFEAPWQVMSLEPVRSDGRLWLALANAPWWPAALVSLDARGHATLRYTQPGVVYVLRTVEWDGRTLVLASGVNNDHEAASLAVIDPHQPPASAPPGAGARYACADCPRGNVSRYLLFEPSPANVAVGLTYNRADGLEVGPDITLSTFETERAAIMYRLSRDFRLLSATPSDTYWSPELRAASPGAFAHDPLVAQVREWTPSGWTRSVLPYPPR